MVQKTVVEKKPEAQIIPPTPIVLPQDREIRACIFTAAAVSLQYKLFEKLPYQIEIKNAQISSLSNLPRDVGKASVEQMAAIKREGKLIGDTEDKRVNLKQYSPVILVLTILAVAVVIFYANYNVGFKQQIEQFWALNEGYIIGICIIFFGLWVFSRMMRKKPKKA